MKKHIYFLGVILIMGVLSTSCSDFSGNIKFENCSSRDVWIDHVDGLGTRVKCGLLTAKNKKNVKNNKKIILMGSTKMPEHLTLHWSYDYDHADQSTDLSLKEVRRPKKRDECLRIFFTKEKQWNVKCEKISNACGSAYYPSEIIFF